MVPPFSKGGVGMGSPPVSTPSEGYGGMGVGGGGYRRFHNTESQLALANEVGRGPTGTNPGARVQATRDDKTYETGARRRGAHRGAAGGHLEEQRWRHSWRCDRVAERTAASVSETYR